MTMYLHCTSTLPQVISEWWLVNGLVVSTVTEDELIHSTWHRKNSLTTVLISPYHHSKLTTSHGIGIKTFLLLLYWHLHTTNYKSPHWGKWPVYSPIEITSSRLGILCPHTLLFRSVWSQDSYLLHWCQGLVHSQSISQGSRSRISNSIPSKTVKESIPECK